MRGGLRIVLLALVPTVTLLVVEARPLMALVFSGPYSLGAPYLQVLAAAHGGFFTLFFMLGYVGIASGAERGMALIIAALLPLAFVAETILTRELGAIGAALGALTATAAGTFAVAALLWRQIGPLIDGRLVLQLLVAGAAMAGGASLINATGFVLLLEMAAVTAGYGIVLLLIGAVRPSDLALIIRQRASPTA